MAAPTVQTLAQALADLNPAYAGQEDVLAKQQAAIGAKYNAQRAGLTAEKGQGFNDINDSARGRGVGAAFSGIPLDEQARYLSTKYLPGVQASQAQENEDNLAIQGQRAQLNAQKNTAALSRIDAQQSALNQWNMQQEQLAAQARENALSRAASARQASASQVNLYDTIDGMLQKRMGADGKVSPSAWRQAVAYAHRNGLNFSGKNGFASQFWGYANDKYYKEYRDGYGQFN